MTAFDNSIAIYNRGCLVYTFFISIRIRKKFFELFTAGIFVPVQMSPFCKFVPSFLILCIMFLKCHYVEGWYSKCIILRCVLYRCYMFNFQLIRHLLADICEIFSTCVSTWFLHVYLKKYVIARGFRKTYQNVFIYCRRIKQF